MLLLHSLFTCRCHSKIGRQNGEQIVSIGQGCTTKSTVMHELMHAIGFFHENSRYDRDQFVKVLWWNIKQGETHHSCLYKPPMNNVVKA